MKAQNGERLSSSSSSTMALLLFFTFSLSSISTTADFNSPPPLSGDHRKNYIIFVMRSPSSFSSSSRQDIQSFAIKTLENILGSQKAAMESLGYIYRNVGTGFSAALTPHQASLLKQEPGVISVMESKVHHYDSHQDLVLDEGCNMDEGC